ncbi:hypothetical protein [Microseira wollei]|nr:hypothetical protein [Microseira wollei]
MFWKISPRHQLFLSTKLEEAALLATFACGASFPKNDLNRTQIAP